MLVMRTVEIDGWTNDGEKKDLRPRDVDGAGNIARFGKKATGASKRITDRRHTRANTRRRESRTCDVRYKSVARGWHMTIFHLNGGTSTG